MSEHERFEWERSDDESMDRLLGRSMGGAPQPSLSPAFERRLARRLAPPRRLSVTGRRVLALYSMAALAASVWVMRSASISWGLVLVAVAVPLLVVAAVYRRRVSPIS